MSEPYIGEIRMFAGNFPPAGWSFCNGAQMSISQNDALFTLIGTTYGGDGQETFNLPNLQGRAPVHMGTSTADGQTYVIGEAAGVESVTLTTQQIPIHNHAFIGTTNGATQVLPTGNLLGVSGTIQYTRIATATQTMAANSLTPVGGSQPHDNMQPYLVVNFIISLFGVFPTQN